MLIWHDDTLLVGLHSDPSSQILPGHSIGSNGGWLGIAWCPFGQSLCTLVLTQGVWNTKNECAGLFVVFKTGHMFL